MRRLVDERDLYYNIVLGIKFIKQKIKPERAPKDFSEGY